MRLDIRAKWPDDWPEIRQISSDGGTVQRVYIFFYYHLGTLLEPLTKIPGEAKYGDVLWPLWEARIALNTQMANTVVPMTTARTACAELINQINSLVPEEFQEAIAKDAASQVFCFGLAGAVTRFQTVLGEELRLVDTYAISRKAAYVTAQLIDDADSLFPETVRVKLSDKVRADVQQAGRCFAFATPTASAFHMFRAIEAAMLDYYSFVTGKPSPLRARNWGVYIDKMKKSGKADDKIIKVLTHIKDSYRNPITHPEVVTSAEDAQVLLGLMVSAVTLMVRAMT